MRTPLHLIGIAIAATILAGCATGGSGGGGGAPSPSGGGGMPGGGGGGMPGGDSGGMPGGMEGMPQMPGGGQLPPEVMEQIRRQLEQQGMGGGGGP